MSRYIDAGELIKTLNREGVPFNEDVNHFILHAPAADVAEVRHGRNLDAEYSSLFECSVCHWSCWDTLCGDTPTYNYCPNCGAKMDGGG